MQPFVDERQSSPRHGSSDPVVVAVSSWSELVARHANDIGSGGMFVRTDAPPERDARVTVRLVLPRDAGTLQLVGVVVHVVTAAQARAHGLRAGFGVQLSDLTPARRLALQRLVEHARRRAAGAAIADALPRILEALAAPPPTERPHQAHAAEPEPAATPVPVAARVRARDELTVRSEQIAALLRRREPTSPASSPAAARRGAIDQALRLAADKRYVEAIERIEGELQRAPSQRLRALSCVVQARQALSERDFPRARARYQDVLALDPGNEVAQRELLMLSAMLSPSTHA